MDFEPLNRWTSTFYVLMHSLEIAHTLHFGNQQRLAESIESARSWIQPDCSFNTVVIPPKEMRASINFRRDPVKRFSDIAENVVKMLVQDLVVLFDGLMSQILKERGERAGAYPQSKIEKLAIYLDPNHDWARKGCLELIAVRNVLCHAGGNWNKKSIRIVKDFISPPPSEGDKLSIGFAMLFYYRKAIRTFVNETKP